MTSQEDGRRRRRGQQDGGHRGQEDGDHRGQEDSGHRGQEGGGASGINNQSNHDNTDMAHVQPTKISSLTDLGNDGPAATEVLKYLVQAVGRDVVSFQRNTQVSYLVVERARDILKEINEYIDKVQTSTDVDWDSFEKFTMAIDPLEETLFDLLAFTKDEKEQHFSNIGSVDKCILSAVHWVRNRTELFKSLGGFDTREGLDKLSDGSKTRSRQLEHQEAQFYDDKALLEELSTTIKGIISGDSNKFPTYVQTAEASLNSLQTEVINGSASSAPEWLRVITIQTSILVEGIVKIVKEATLSTDIQNHLKSKPVWKAASELITDIIQNKTQPTLPKSVENKYSALIDILPTSGGFTLPQGYVELIKQVGYIRRPFQAQAIALVGHCHFLAGQFNAKAKGKSLTVENSNSLDEAFDSTLRVLKDVVKTFSQIELKAFDLTNFENHATVKAFGVAEGLIRKSFISFELDSEWTPRQSALDAARKKDEKRMKDLSEVYTRNTSSSTTKVTVNVNIHDKSDKLLGKASVEEDDTMRLLALRWRVAGVLTVAEEMRRAREAGTFFKDGQPLALQSMLAAIRGGAGSSEVTLKLVVPAPAVPVT